MNDILIETISECKQSFGNQPKFEDLADYLPFLYAFGEVEFTYDHISKLRTELNADYLYVLRKNRLKIIYFQENYEIILGLIEIYRLSQDESILDLAIHAFSSAEQKFIWKNRIVSGYSELLNLPIPLISFYNYVFVELALDLYELTKNESYLQLSSSIINDSLETPFFKQYHLFPIDDYLVFRALLFNIRPPRTCFIGKTSALIFGLLKYCSICQAAHVETEIISFLDAINKHMVKDNIVYRHFRPKTNQLSDPNLAAAFMYLNMLNYAFVTLHKPDLLGRAMQIADFYLTTQSNLGLFPYKPGDNRSWIDSETDFAISLLELYEISGDQKYHDAAQRCYDALLKYNLKTSSVDIDTGEHCDPVNFRSYRTTPKFKALFLKLAYYFENQPKLFGPGGKASLFRDR